MDSELDTATERLFASVVGTPLIGLARHQYSFNGEPFTEDAGPLQLQFVETAITLKLRGDGQSVTADTKAFDLPPAFSLDSDAHCSWAHVNMFDSEQWSRLRNQTLRVVDAIVDTWLNDNTSYVSGWFLTFDDNHLCYINWGDNARIMLDEPFPMTDHDDFQTSRQAVASA